ncbi:MAG: septum site-determining protein Ssd [Candidatus Sericytochromatia bacterium]
MASTGVLGIVDEPALRDGVDRVAAAAGVRVVYCTGTRATSRREWSAATAVVLDEAAVRRSAAGGMPRRQQVILLVGGEPPQEVWRAAISVGAQHVLRLPEQEAELVDVLSDAGESSKRRHGNTVAVVGGRGGAGASIFSAALAIAASDALLVDVDPWGGGVDLLLGLEGQPGLRWPDIAVQNGRLSLPAIRDALPSHRNIGVLSGARHEADITGGSLFAIVDAGRRGGVMVVCDLPRRLTEAAETALDAADLVVVVAACDVRSCAAASAMVPTLSDINPNVGLVVRGPSPGGLRAADVARATGLPLLAAMRPEPNLPDRLERAGLRLRRRSHLLVAARRVLAVLGRHAVVEAA